MDASSVANILTDAEVQDVVSKAIGNNKKWKLLQVEEKRAAEEMSGFNGEHRRMTLRLDVEGVKENIYLFVKLVPRDEDRAAVTKEVNLFNREALALTLIEKITKPDPNPWCATSYLKNENIIVMPDLALDGYKNISTNDYDNLPHELLMVVALARFHAAFANYETKINLLAGRPNTFEEEYGDQLKETLFVDNPFFRASAIFHANYLKEQSNKYCDIDIDFLPLYHKAVESVKTYENTLNTLIHRDLWVNNIMFKYVNGVPINALLIDFQIVRYAPPAFDPMVLLYMTTTKSFREKSEETVLKKYYSTFMEEVDEDTKKRLAELNYDWNSFREWCEKARMFGMVCAMIICPFAFLDIKFAETLYNNKEEYGNITEHDRSKTFIQFAKNNEDYNERVLGMFEEFVDRYASNL